jgi:hypothetical protein
MSVGIAVRRPSIVAPLAHGGESKNCEVPVLNMTSVGKCHNKISPGKNTDFRSFHFWDARYRVCVCFTHAAALSSQTYINLKYIKHEIIHMPTLCFSHQ